MRPNRQQVTYRTHWLMENEVTQSKKVLSPRAASAMYSSTSTSIFGNDMPILHAASALLNKLASAQDTHVARALADSSDCGLLWEQSPPKCEIVCQRRWWTTVQNLTLLALSLADKSSTVQTYTQNYIQTVTDIFLPCLSACVDKNGSHTSLVT